MKKYFLLSSVVLLLTFFACSKGPVPTEEDVNLSFTWLNLAGVTGAFHEAVYKGDLDSITRLAKGDIINRPEDVYIYGYSAFEEETLPEEEKVIYIIATRPLHIAVISGNKEVVQRLISLGADVNLTDEKGNTALDIALQNGQEEIALILKNTQKRP